MEYYRDPQVAEVIVWVGSSQSQHNTTESKTVFTIRNSGEVNHLGSGEMLYKHLYFVALQSPSDE